MDTKAFVERQKRGFETVIRIFAIVVSLMWFAAMLDHWLDLGWGWDEEVLWMGPAMIGFAVVLRFVGHAIFRFIGENY